MKQLLSILIAAAIAGAGALLYAWSGVYDIAATTPHWALTTSFIDMLKERSIEGHSGGIQAPNSDDPNLREASLPHYHEMCRRCHGAPGQAPEEFSKGLYPAPPSMVSGHIQEELSTAEVYWVIKHGIKMTGMPAFGPTHSEDILWGLTALATEMPRMRPDQYRQQIETAGSAERTAHGHSHGGSNVDADPDHGGHKHTGNSDAVETHD
ncbi:MAG: cytochrome c [Desulfococcus multivorans]|jgi:mono/diheme cytochrome c family protein|uniref:c-type cytochrome n=1 Tax=Desulfococcus sp. TaxID=2025834 RepID=UPI002A3C8317|nr:cytochrome c [Desulfococcus multivorans]